MPDATGTIRDRIVDFRRVPAGELKANPRNWRTHPEGQRRALTDMLERVGFAGAVLARETDDGLELIDGHLRADVADGFDVPVLVLDVDDAEALLLLATIDPLGAMAEVDEAALAALLQDAAVGQADLEAHLVQFLAKGSGAGVVSADEVPRTAKTIRASEGEVWQLGRHRVMCGDSTNPAHVQTLAEGVRVDLIATDPPYGVDIGGEAGRRANPKGQAWEDLHGDDDPTEAADIVQAALEEAYKVAADGCAVLVWHPPGNDAERFRLALVAAGVKVAKPIIWVKPTLVFGRHEYHWKHETAFYGWFDGSRANFYGDRSATTVWAVDYAPGIGTRNAGAMKKYKLEEHPTQKPVELTTIPIENHTLPTGVVYDPFAGSGSAVIAAEQTGRTALAMEVDPAYVDVIVRRWELYTGQEATLDG